MNRLTAPGGDYCRDECGQENSCKRLEYARRMGDMSLRCKDALRYERLRMYENAEEQAERVKGDSDE